ncbi:uncharacterized protein TrAtP1_011261 [Trichoderma atroviride]|uniref:uncharacterized protein n=1 Tax=Hypocrea atroviridis TaxID=63577 RepID=UPI003321D531|nr:hypothetical protein TrAtP1_011261 [Trichoderma atroviride]
MDAEMLARELDPVGQSRYETHFSNQGGHQRTKKGRGSSPRIWYTPCLAQAILLSLLVLYSVKMWFIHVKSPAVSCRREAGNHGRHLEQNGPSHAPARIHPWPLQPLLGSVFSARLIWTLNGWEETTDKFAFFLLFPFERFSRIRYTVLFTSPEHISLLPLPKQQWKKGGGGDMSFVKLTVANSQGY